MSSCICSSSATRSAKTDARQIPRKTQIGNN
jgi:hypothetical protein